MPNFPVDPPTSPVDKNVTLYHAQPHGNQDALRQLVRPEVFVNIEPLLDAKAQMLALHKSQKEWLDQSQGMESYIESMKMLCSHVGALSGRFRFAEGWRRHSHLGFCGEGDDPLVELLAEHTHVTESN